jgi:transposase
MLYNNSKNDTRKEGCMSDYIIHQGVDLHKKFFNFFSYDERTGKSTEGKVFNNDREERREYLEMFDAPSQVAVEATRNWYWFIDMLQEAEIKVHLSNPKQTKAIAWARVKNDKVDARTLCKLLKANILPTCWIPEKKMRDIREMVRFRTKLVRIRTQAKNMIHSYLGKQNVTPPVKNLWTLEGRKWLEGDILKTPHGEMKDYCLKLISSLDEMINEYDKKLEKIGYKPKGIELVETIPNTGYTRALTIITETGPIELFKRAKSYVACSGLAPTTRGSAGHFKQGRLSKEARLSLKWTFIEIANRAWMIDIDLRKYFSRIQNRRGKKIAKISLARKLAKGVYHMLKDNITFNDYKKRYLAG